MVKLKNNLKNIFFIKYSNLIFLNIKLEFYMF